VCEGLAFLHDELRIIHTDLKPENVLLSAHAARIIVPDGPWSTQHPHHHHAHHHQSAPTHAPLAPPAESTALAAADPSAVKLTKNQKKKLRQKANKLAAAAKGDDDSGAELASVVDADLPTHVAADQPSADADTPPLQPNAAVTSASTSPTHEAEAEAEAAAEAVEAEVVLAVAEEAAAEAAAVMVDSGGVVERVREFRAVDMTCKVADLGNACWTYKQFTKDVQTRQCPPHPIPFVPFPLRPGSRTDAIRIEQYCGTCSAEEPTTPDCSLHRCATVLPFQWQWLNA
jgi:serine/threonine-protein kinase SRPK3